MRAASLIVLAVLATALLPAAAPAATPAAPVTETASSGAVTATFTHQDGGDGTWRAMRITVTRAGVPAYAGLPRIRGCAQPYCGPDTVDGDRGALAVADITGDAEPEVIVNFYAGGAHCCEIAVVLQWTGSAYTVIQHNFADPGYKLETATDGGPALFLTGDARFAYAYTAYAFSALPVAIYRIENGRFVDATALFLPDVTADAARLKKAYMKVRRTRESLGVLAAWVADEYRLGLRGVADRFLQHELRAGRLRTSQGWPGGKAYIKQLRRDLRSWGYAPAPAGGPPR
jgi:hypothetical protein